MIQDDTIMNEPMALPSSQYHNNNNRQCSSMEIQNVPFPYDGCTAQTTTTATITKSQSIHSSWACGICQQNPFTVALQELSQHLQRLFQYECSDMVIYGVAFGERYETMLLETNDDDDNATIALIAQQNKCSFMFLLDHDADGKSTPSTTATRNRINNHNNDNDNDRSNLRFRIESTRSNGYIIRIPPSLLPYKNHRRNTKLFKMYGGFAIFQFAKRLVWRDAKLIKALSSQTNYQTFFHENIVNTGNVCASFRAMPKHSNTMGFHPTNSDGPTFFDHCHVLLHTTRKKSPITDSRQSIQYQCDAYQNQTTSPTLSLNDGMIDSALILWDMSTTKCQQFNSQLACTWLDETQCYGDRDQISFPQALRSMNNLYASKEVAVQETMSRDRIYHDQTTNHSMLHIGRGACHWYYMNHVNLMDCVNNVHKEYNNMPSKRVAIVVVGSLQRYNLNSTLHHVIKPLTAQGHQPDYFVSVARSSLKAYRGTMKYMNHLSIDPSLLLSSKHDDYDDINSTEAATRTTTIESRIQQLVQNVGGNPRHIEILDHPYDSSQHPSLVAKRAEILQKYPNQDPDVHFPTYDTRNPYAIPRTRRGNKNMLALFYNTKSLWDVVVETERQNQFQYDYVMFLRDDTMWMNDFDLNELLHARSSVNETETTRQGNETEVYALSCDARQPTMHPLEINNHIAIVKRNRAELFGNYFEHLFDDGVVDGCNQQLTDAFSEHGLRGCNSEMILKWFLKVNNVQVQLVSQSLIPFQRSIFVDYRGDNDNETVIVPCYHKFCQSYDMPLPDYHPEMQHCEALYPTSGTQRSRFMKAILPLWFDAFQISISEISRRISAA